MWFGELAEAVTICLPPPFFFTTRPPLLWGSYHGRAVGEVVVVSRGSARLWASIKAAVRRCNALHGPLGRFGP